MSEASTAPNKVSKEQAAVLCAIYRFLTRTSNWPKLADVDKELRQRGINAALVIRDIPTALLHGGHRGLQPQPHTELTLTLAGLAHCPGSAGDIALFLRAMRSLARYESRRGPATMIAPVIVTSRELGRAWRLPREQRSTLVRACRLLLVENWGGVGNEPHGDMAFEFQPSREIHRFRAVRSLEDYDVVHRQWDAEQTASIAPWEASKADVIDAMMPAMTTEETVGAVLKKWRPELQSEVDDLEPSLPGMKQALQRIERSWSASWLGYHSRLYFDDFTQPPLSAQFDPEWGGIHGIPNGWAERPVEEVAEAVVRFSSPDAAIEIVEDRLRQLQADVQQFKDELHLALPDTLTPKQRKLTQQIDDLKFEGVRGRYIASQAPNQFMTRDSMAMSQKPRVPAHVSFMGLQEEAAVVVESTRQALRYAGYLAVLSMNVEPAAVASTPVTLYVAESVRSALTDRGSLSSWHTGKLLALIDELDVNYGQGNGYAAHMLLRGILDHVPPVLKQPHFAAVANNYSWGQTDKGYMKRLLDYKLQGDDALHRQISKRADTLSLSDLPPSRYLNRLLEEVADQL